MASSSSAVTPLTEPMVRTASAPRRTTAMVMTPVLLRRRQDLGVVGLHRTAPGAIEPGGGLLAARGGPGSQSCGAGVTATGAAGCGGIAGGGRGC